MNFDQYVTEWNGRQVTRFGGECVAGVAEFEAENNLPIIWGELGAVLWINNPLMLNIYDWVVNDPNDPNQLPPRGAIVAWNADLPGGGGSGHIAFFDHNLENHEFMSFGQNYGGPKMHFQPVTWNYVAGWYVPKQVEPPAPPPVVNPYTIELISPKQVKLNKDTHLWGLNYDNFTAIDNNPQADAMAGTILTVRAVLHHNIGYNYYLSDPNVASGYNVLDTDDYTPPPPEPHQPPDGPMVIPNNETYDLIKDVGGYITSNQAVNHVNEGVNIPAGSYFIFNKRFNVADASQLIAINLTKTPGKPGAWINPLDNQEVAPEPAAPELPAEELIVPTPVNEPDFTTTYKSLPEPLVYVAMRDVPVADLAGTKTVTMPKYSVTYIAGSFTHNGVDYARPKSAVDKNMWWGIEWVDSQTKLPNIELESEVFNAKTTVAEREATKTLHPLDRLALGVAHARNIYLAIVSFFSKIKLARKNKN